MKAYSWTLNYWNHVDRILYWLEPSRSYGERFQLMPRRNAHHLEKLSTTTISNCPQILFINSQSFSIQTNNQATMVTSPSSKKHRVRFNESLPTNTGGQSVVRETMIGSRSPSLPLPVPTRGVKQSPKKRKIAPPGNLSFPYTYPLERPSLKNRTMGIVPPRDLVLSTGLQLHHQRAQRMRCIDIIDCALDILESVDYDWPSHIKKLAEGIFIIPLVRSNVIKKIYCNTHSRNALLTLFRVLLVQDSRATRIEDASILQLTTQLTTSSVPTESNPAYTWTTCFGVLVYYMESTMICLKE